MLFGSSTDEVLVKKALSGKADAWERLIKRYERKIYNFALRMTGNREDAMDLMQDIFLAVYRGLNGFRAESSFSSWLFAIASLRAKDFYRKRKQADSLEDEELLPERDGEIGPHGALFRNQRNQFLLEALAQLPGEQRLVLELKFFQEMTFDEISDQLGVSSNTLKSRLYAGLRKIKEMPEVAHAV